PSSADLVVYVLPGKGTSVHLLAADGSQRVLVYAVDEFGTVSAENSVAVALHELGHIWCCFGAGAGPDGHWLEKIPDPLLQGGGRQSQDRRDRRAIPVAPAPARRLQHVHRTRRSVQRPRERHRREGRRLQRDRRSAERAPLLTSV